MRNYLFLALAALVLAASTPAMAAMSHNERVFLTEDGLSAREATMKLPTVQPQSGPLESAVTNQGGSTSKACDTATISANTATQVSSDNAGPNNGITGTWEQVAGGTVNVYNSHGTPLYATLDVYYGSQTQCGTTLSCYYHVTTAATIPVLAGSGAQLAWHVVDTVPELSDHTSDYVAYYAYLTTSQSSSCANNSYWTFEHN